MDSMLGRQKVWLGGKINKLGSKNRHREPFIGQEEAILKNNNNTQKQCCGSEIIFFGSVSRSGSDYLGNFGSGSGSDPTSQ